MSELPRCPGCGAIYPGHPPDLCPLVLPTPVQRHWTHVEELRLLYQSMPAGPGRVRVEARWKAALADHQVFVNQQAGDDHGPSSEHDPAA